MVKTLMKGIAALIVVVLMMGVLALTVGYKMINKEAIIPGVTVHGVPCIGAFDKENPAFEYKVDTTNLVLGIVFIETVVMPVVVANNYLRCPVALAAH